MRDAPNHREAFGRRSFDLSSVIHRRFALARRVFYSNIFLMSWLNWLENRVGFLAIPRLIPAIALLNLFVYVLFQFQPEYVSFLTLEPALVLRGEVWRLVSYIFIPQYFLGGGSILQSVFFLLYVWFMIWVGNSLEHAWGAFRLTLYYALGMAGVTIAAFLLGAGQSEGNVLPLYINMSLFFAFATLFPNVQIYVLFIIPLKVKWVALIGLLPILLMFINASLVGKTAIVISLVNYILFFAPVAVSNARHNRNVQKRRLKFTAGSVAADEPLHRCTVCKRTERDDAELEFRVARDGEEYCVEHLPKPVAKTG